MGSGQQVTTKFIMDRVIIHMRFATGVMHFPIVPKHCNALAESTAVRLGERSRYSR